MPDNNANKRHDNKFFYKLIMIVNMKKKIGLSIMVILCTMISRAQDTRITTESSDTESGYKEYIPKVFPPSPTAFKFSTYGNIPLNGSTGAFSYSVPIYTISEKDISLPISLDYSSVGVKIDELSGIVGTDWNLNAGGVISRVMRGHPDEKVNRWYPESIDVLDNDTKEKIISIANGNSIIDVERDWFSFNVNGLSGTFYFDENLNVVVNSKESVKITSERTQGGTYGVMTTFTMTDNKGYIYIFGGSDDYSEGMISSSSSSVGPKDIYYSAWFLKKIISPNQNSIEFLYTDNSFNYNAGTSFYLIYDQSCVCDGYDTKSYSSAYIPNVHYNKTSSRALSEIKFSTGSILFNYNFDRADNGGLSLKGMTIKDRNSNIIKKVSLAYDMTYQVGSHRYYGLSSDKSLCYRLFLKEIAFTSKNDQIGEKYTFEYDGKERLPLRLSFSKDKYGYYNGSSNLSPFSKELVDDQVVSTLLKAYNGTSYTTANLQVNSTNVYSGMLTKIYYPTGGYTKINYQANSTDSVGTKIEYEKLNVMVLKDCSSSSVNTQSATFTATTNTKIKYSAGGSLRDIPGCMAPSPDQLHDKYSFTVYDLTTNQLLLSYNRPYGSPITDQDVGAKQVQTQIGHQYQVTLELLSKKFNTATGNLLVKYNARSVPVNISLYGGGARVGSIEDYNNNGQMCNKKSFYYNTLAEYPSTRSSLVRVLDPQYYDLTKYQKNCKDACYKEWIGGTYDPSYFYNKVTISSSSFSSLYDNRKQGSYYTHITEFVENGTQNSGVIERTFYNIDDYPANNVIGPRILGVPYSNEGDGYYGLLKEESSYKKETDKYTLLQKRKWNYSPSPKAVSSYVFRLNYELPSDILYLDPVPRNISVATYSNYMNVMKLVNTSDSIYSIGGVTSSFTYNNYGNSPYYNILSQKKYLSTGESLITRYQYASDLLGQLSNMDRLINSNRVGIPIVTQTSKGVGISKQISLIKCTYKYISKQRKDGLAVDLLLPESIYTAQDDTVASSLEKRISYDNYDEYGNIVQYTADGVNGVILWGYDGQYPIADIKGATYEEVMAALGFSPESISKNSIPDMVQVDSLRVKLPNAFVITYIYQPLVGVISSTDPSGITTYYDYDDFNRLKRTYIKEKDSSGNEIEKNIQTYDYHYKNQ